MKLYIFKEDKKILSIYSDKKNFRRDVVSYILNKFVYLDYYEEGGDILNEEYHADTSKKISEALTDLVKKNVNFIFKDCIYETEIIQSDKLAPYVNEKKPTAKKRETDKKTLWDPLPMMPLSPLYIVHD